MAKRRWWRRRKPGKLTTPDGLSAVTLPPGYLEALSLYGLRGSYGHIYRTQPNVRTVVDFLAKQVASLQLKHYAKIPTVADVAPNAIIELEDSDLVDLLNHPSPKMSRYRFWRETVGDIGVYDTAYWRKVYLDGNVNALIRILPSALTPDRDPSTRLIRWYNTTLGGRVYPNELVIFHGYDPELQDGCISPLETLRRILAEEYAAGLNREYTWKNSSRKDGVVERPETAPVWDDAQREAWRLETEGITAGAANAGRILLLEDGMKWNASSWSPEEMEYLEARKLSRMECASAFGVDPRLVFATDQPITSEARVAFYTDQLNPLLERLAEEINVQLVPDFEPLRPKEQYVKFSMEHKLRGSFVEEAKLASTLVGKPVLTVNEYRRRLEEPPLPGGDDLAVPLNTTSAGGPQASPQAPMQTPGEQPVGVTPGGGPPNEPLKDWLDAEQKAWLDAERLHKRREAVSEVVRRHLGRQEKTVLSLAGALARQGSVTVESIWDMKGGRWDRELTEDLERVGLNGDSAETAHAINEMTKLRLSEVLEAGGPLSEAFQWHEEVLYAS